ncbi:MAG: hypothetical protein ACR2IK_02560 [Chloroflexota bacterium]
MPLLVLFACGAPPAPSIPPTAVATATSVRPTMTPVPATPSPVPTARASATLAPTATVGLIAESVSAVTALQATSAAVVPTVATAIASIVEHPETQELLRQVTDLLGGVSVSQLEQSPAGASPVDTTRLSLHGSDTAGYLARLQPLARRLVAGAAVAAAGQVFPNAAIELVVVDGSGKIIVDATRQPGYQPQVAVSD